MKSFMTEVERIVDQMNRAFAGEAWHGPAMMEILQDMTAQQATARPFDGAHSIWELVLHIAAWQHAARRRLSGDRAQLPETEDWPPVDETDEQAWTQTKEALRQSYAELCAAISQLDESRLDQPIIEGMSTVYVTLHGIVQHTLYHAGQIAILKKAASERQIV
jgi:uncharacterized damage-inducible protein DinB